MRDSSYTLRDPLSWILLLWAAVIIGLACWAVVVVPYSLVKTWPCWERACTIEEQCRHNYVYDRAHKAQLCHR